MPAKNDDLLVTARKRFDEAKSAWSEIREQYAEDSRFVNVLGGQWNKASKDSREGSGKPALEFNELHIYVQQVVNRARQDRPEPRVAPGDDEATDDGAEFLEGRLRHIQYASQADVAYDCAVEAAATGGFGFYGIETEYTDKDMVRGGKPSPNQEPRLFRILDPTAEYPDPNCLEPDFSDAKYWFSRQWIDRDEFKKKFKVDPIQWDKDSTDWATDSQVAIAQYWYVEETTRRYVWLSDGTEGYDDALTAEQKGVEVENEREVVEREVCCKLIDGEKVLKTIKWLGNWIPRVPVLGREVIVDGKKQYISIIRFAHDAQKLKNGFKSGIANLLGLSSTAPWIGYKGQFKDGKWRDAHTKNYAYLESELVSLGGQIAPLPQRNTYEAPIQSLSLAAMQAGDDIKRGVGYSDSVLQPSKASDLSGVAISKRQNSVDLANFHFEDNLVRSQWHGARILLDLDMKLADTPRMMTSRKLDGTAVNTPVSTKNEDGTFGIVPGQENVPHLRFDIGRYTITTGPNYNTKREEEREILLQSFQADPQLWTIFGDVLFKIMGYPDLEERAKMALPPQIQQAIANKGQQQIPPQIQAQMAQLMQQNAGFKQAIQQLVTIVKTKQIEAAGKLHVEQMKTAREVTLEGIKQRHEVGLEHQADVMEAIKHLMDMLHESELGATPGPGFGNNALPQPAGVQAQ
jgi:hypothetical protein